MEEKNAQQGDMEPAHQPSTSTTPINAQMASGHVTGQTQAQQAQTGQSNQQQTQGQQTSLQTQTQQNTQGPCPPNVSAFLNNMEIQQTLQTVATALNTDVNFIGAHASMESGWLDAHNAGLNNLFGLTRGGGRNLSFPSLAASGQAYINAPSVNGVNPTKVYGATTIEQFADQLQSPNPYRYNSVDVNGYRNKLIKQYKFYVRMVGNCQTAQ